MKDCGERLDGNARAGCPCEGCKRIRARKAELMRAYRSQRPRPGTGPRVVTEEASVLERVARLVRD